MGRRRLRAATVMGAGALLLVVALTVGGDSIQPAAHLQVWLPPHLLDIGVTVGLGASLAIIGLAAYVVWAGRHDPLVVELPKRPSSLRIMIGYAISLLLLAMILRLGRGRPFGIPLIGPPAPGSTPVPPRGLAAIAGAAGIEWQLVAAGLALMALLAAAAAIVIWRRSAAAKQAPRPGRAVRDAVEAGLESLAEERDPRAAVIVAYARMEWMIAGHGLPRRPWEAPFEYLVRVLLELRVSGGSIQRLTELFELARFSEHEVSPAMREAAIAALASIGGQLSRLEAEAGPA